MERHSTYSRRPVFSLPQIVGLIAGLVLTALGLIAVLELGVTLEDRPRTDVMGLDHTSMLGLIELVLGVILLALAAARDRAGTIFIGALLIIAAFVAFADTPRIQENFGLESSHGLVYLILGVPLVLAGLFGATVTKRHAENYVEPTDEAVAYRQTAAAPVEPAAAAPAADGVRPGEHVEVDPATGQRIIVPD